jgi:hypothetical protein
VVISRKDAKNAKVKITAVPLAKIRHTGLGPVSSQPLKNMDSGSAKIAVRNKGLFFDFNDSQTSMYPSGVY